MERTTTNGSDMGNFYAELEQVFERNAERDCLRLGDGSVWTYGEMRRWISALAGRLIEHGVQAGERVVVQVDKSPQNLALYLATLKVGGIYVPLNTAYTPG